MSDSTLRQIAALEREIFSDHPATCAHVATLRQFDSGQALLPCAWPECRNGNYGPGGNGLRIVIRAPLPALNTLAFRAAPLAYETEDYQRLMIGSGRAVFAWVWVKL